MTPINDVHELHQKSMPPMPPMPAHAAHAAHFWTASRQIGFWLVSDEVSSGEDEPCTIFGHRSAFLVTFTGSITPSSRGRHIACFWRCIHNFEPFSRTFATTTFGSSLHFRLSVSVEPVKASCTACNAYGMVSEPLFHEGFEGVPSLLAGQHRLQLLRLLPLQHGLHSMHHLLWPFPSFRFSCCTHPEYGNPACHLNDFLCIFFFVPLRLGKPFLGFLTSFSAFFDCLFVAFSADKCCFVLRYDDFLSPTK